ncbi:MAG: ABC transporter ATP-binding protein [Mogibacterium sp.]|nr:ABC transporter ATP-binding protein [Mogibacterium sp.]
MISYYRPYMGLFIADMIFATLSSAVALTIPLVVRYITSTLIYMQPDALKSQLLLIALFLIALLAVDFVSRYFIGNYGHVMGAKIEYDMRSEIFDHLQKMSFTFYDKAKVGQLMSRVTTDLFDITELLHHGPENILLSLLKIVGALVILFGINAKLTFAAFIILPFMFAFAYVLNKKMRRAFRANRQRIAEINGQIEDNLAGIKVVKSFANEDVENEKFKVGNDNFLDSKRNNYRYMGIFQAGVGVFTSMITVCVVVVGCLLIADGNLNVSDLVAFLLYIGVFTEPIKTLVDFTEMFQNGYSGFERFREIMNMSPDIEDSPNAIELGDVEGAIEFRDVSFGYSDSSDNVLEHINLDIPAGSYIALVGSSGAGKTTLCSLIPRFYDVSDGAISIDGVDIRNVKMKSLRSKIGIVQQDVYLFAGTIYENILYGKPDATEEEVVEAAKRANAHDFIMSLEDGYDTDIGQRGARLSGGQKQRLSIARVFLKNPPILIFDEATSALDNESERLVQESLEVLAENRTTIVIAHRLSTIQNAERILVLTEEGIAESGTHEELLNMGGVYEQLYRG